MVGHCKALLDGISAQRAALSKLVVLKHALRQYFGSTPKSPSGMVQEDFRGDGSLTHTCQYGGLLLLCQI